MPTNEEILQKALTEAANLATAGALNPEQEKIFLSYLFDLTTWRQVARVQAVESNKWELNKLALGKRGMVLATEAQDPGLRRNVTPSKITLQPFEVMLPWEIGDNFAEVNIEGEAVERTIARLMATQFGNDWEDMMVNSNTLGHAAKESDLIDGGDGTNVIKDALFAKSGGWLKLAQSGNVLDAKGSNVGAKVFSSAIQTMPVKFRRNRSLLRWMMSSDLYQLWLESLTSRIGTMADSVLSGAQGAPAPYGIPAVEMPLFPFRPRNTEHLSLAGTTQTQLAFAPINSGTEVVTVQTLDKVPTAPLVKDTDYTIDYTLGKIARKAGADPLAVKVTYETNPQMILTLVNNPIVAIGRGIRIERDRDIFRRVNQFATTAKVAWDFEEVTAVVLVKNMGTAA